jgi:hypothetical protein
LAVRIIDRAAGAVALLCGLLLLLAVATMVARGFQPGPPEGLISRIENSWLVLLYKLHFTTQGIRSDMLRSQNAVDYIVLALACATCVDPYGYCRRRQGANVFSIMFRLG